MSRADQYINILEAEQEEVSANGQSILIPSKVHDNVGLGHVNGNRDRQRPFLSLQLLIQCIALIAWKRLAKAQRNWRDTGLVYGPASID